MPSERRVVVDRKLLEDADPQRRDQREGAEGNDTYRYYFPLPTGPASRIVASLLRIRLTAAAAAFRSAARFLVGRRPMHAHMKRSISNCSFRTPPPWTGLFSFLTLLGLAVAPLQAGPVEGWLEWRGPSRDGVSRETGLPDKVDVKQPLWTAAFPGQSTPVIANGRLYINGFMGAGPDLQEYIACFDAETGQKLWSQAFNDFLSDTIYLRYATSSPTVDAETGNVYMQGTQGILACFSQDGKLLWQHSLMEEYGRLTFPNGRTASPVVDQDLVITRGITSSWGAHGPAGDRFYAFDKKTGELVWSSAPGDRPQDNTFSHPWLDFWNGQRVLYSAGGDCSLLAINARTGEPLWRVLVAKAGAKGGINAAVVRYQDKLIVIHESENLDSSEIGRMAAMKIPASITKTNPLVPHIFVPKQLEEIGRASCRERVYGTV